jgi:hypothetical protein
MKKFSLIIFLSLLFSSCQKPEMTGPVTIGGPKNCVGGGCAMSTAAELKFEISSNGYVSYSKEFMKGPADQRSPENTGLWGSVWSGIKDYWSPTTQGSVPPTSVPLPTPENPVTPPDQVVATGPGAPSTPGTIGETSEDGNKGQKNNGKGLRGSELDKMVNNFGRHLTTGWDEITGKGRKKRREARETKAKYSEAMALKDRVEGMVTDMDTGSRVIEDVVHDVLDPKKYTPTGDLNGITKSFADDHNSTIESIVGSTNDIDEVEVPAEGPRYDTPELRSVQSARQYQAYVQKKINTMPEGERAQRQPLVNVASDALKVAEDSYRAGDKEKGDKGKELGLAGLDLALSLTPGVGLAKDLVELTTGYNFITGTKLTSFERTMAAVGVLTVGYGSKLALAGKAGALIDIIKLGTKEADAITSATRAVTRAEEIVVAAEKAGVKTEKTIDNFVETLKTSMPCRIAVLSPAEKFIGFIFPTAFAADCLPGVTEDAIISGFKNAEAFKFDVSALVPGNKVDGVIGETLNGAKNITSQFTLTADEALRAGEKWVGQGYKEIGAAGDGVFRSADGLRQFRMDKTSLAGAHLPNVPHIHFEGLAEGTSKVKVNNHVPFVER